MPQLTFKGIKVEELCNISNELKNNLVKLISCEEKHIRFEYCPTVNVKKGTVIESFPKVEMLWFPREQESRDIVAKYITKEISKLGYKHIQVTFNELNPNCYYENGEHF